MEEEWRDIEGYVGIYKVSSRGRILSLHTKKGFIRSQSINKNGYCEVSLSKNGNKTHYRVHRLVAAAFIENPENKPHVNHIDSNRANNAIENLEWVTPAENVNHSWIYGNRKISPRSTLDECKVLTCLTLHHAGIEKPFIFRYYNINESSLNRILRRDTWGDEILFSLIHKN